MSFAISLRGRVKSGEEVCGLGSQIAQVIDFIEDHAGPVEWYVADLDMMGGWVVSTGTAPESAGDSRELAGTFVRLTSFFAVYSWQSPLERANHTFAIEYSRTTR